MALSGLRASEGKRDFGVIADTAATDHTWSRSLLEGALQSAGIKIDGERPWDIQVNDARFYNRVLTRGSLGLGETYVAGWWDCEKIDEAIHKMLEADLERQFAYIWKFGLPAIKMLRAQILNLQSPQRAAENAKFHYDLSTELFRYMLGPTMAYSCAYWRNATNLDRAQWDKLDLVCRKLELCGSDNFLDVGCGWGGFLKHAAAHFGCCATGITISPEQCEFAKVFCEHLPVRVLLSDYRDSGLRRESRFDKIACIGMFEHVGRKNYRRFMEIIDGLLTEDGLFLLQTVGRFEPSGATDPWLNKYIFPNGMLPSVTEIARAAEGIFVLEDWHSFGTDYDRTLLAWHANFEAYAEGRITTIGTRFRRMWRYYLLSCAGSFRARRGPQLWQIVLSKNGVKGGYRSLR
jgi:cyclopropane-fatty-acyl-phospholipid synthase